MDIAGGLCGLVRGCCRLPLYSGGFVSQILECTGVLMFSGKLKGVLSGVSAGCKLPPMLSPHCGCGRCG